MRIRIIFILLFLSFNIITVSEGAVDIKGKEKKEIKKKVEKKIKSHKLSSLKKSKKKFKRKKGFKFFKFWKWKIKNKTKQKKKIDGFVLFSAISVILGIILIFTIGPNLGGVLAVLGEISAIIGLIRIKKKPDELSGKWLAWGILSLAILFLLWFAFVIVVLFSSLN